MTPKPPEKDAVAVPNVFADDQRAEAVAQAIMLGQQQLVQLQIQQRLNGDEDDVAIPGAEPKPSLGRVLTYGERRAAIEQGLVQLVQDNADIRESIERLAEQWRQERADSNSSK